MSVQRFPITQSGYVRLEEELKNLKFNDRPAISKAIAEARELGDLSENAEYHAAREKQSFIEGRIADLEGKLALAEIIDISKLSGKTVMFGATVTIINEETEEEKTYKIVGEYEADINQGLISIMSPLARALIGKDEGDSAEVPTPKGIKDYEILKVKF
jgi:transcription elongation factor GreA